MEYLPKYLQRAGLVSTLLIGGVMGGLMAPLPSEAQTAPTVTVRVDSGEASSILIATSSTCTATELTLGYTQCYAINTGLTVAGAGAVGGVQRSYFVRNAPGATARLRVADNLGQDKLSLIGVQFIPTLANWGTNTANTNEQHVLTITLSKPFDAPSNTGNAGTYVWAIRAGGEFRAGPANALTTACTGVSASRLCDTVGNSVTYPGTGTFSPEGSKSILSTVAGSTINTRPLSLTVAGPTTAIVSFDGLKNATLGQENPTYPFFTCDQNGGSLTDTGSACTPTITQTMTVTLKGPDTFVLVNGQDAFGANCAATLTAKQLKQISFLQSLATFLDWWEDRHRNDRLRAFITMIETFLSTVNSNSTGEGYPVPCPGAKLVNLDIATAAALDQIAFTASGAVPAEPAPPATGTITIKKRTNPNTYNASFGFTGLGSGITNFSILTVEDMCNDNCWGGTKTFSGLLTGEAGGVRTIRETTFPEPPLYYEPWYLYSVNCDGEEGQVDKLYIDYPSGLEGVRVNYLNDNQTLTCTFNNKANYD
jgi:hypothetical protein